MYSVIFIIILSISLLISVLLAGICLRGGLDAKFKDDYTFVFHEGEGFGDISYLNPKYPIAIAEKEKESNEHNECFDDNFKFSKSFIMKPFVWVAKILFFIGKVFHLTYTSVNIIVWYMLLPLVWASILDYKLHQILLAPLWALLCMGIGVIQGKKFNQFCDTLFRLSQIFILSFGNYFLWSVIICLILPILVTIVLIII